MNFSAHIFFSNSQKNNRYGIFIFYLENSNFLNNSQFSSIQLLSRVRLFATPWIAACQAVLSITNSRSLLKLMSIESVMPSSHLFKKSISEDFQQRQLFHRQIVIDLFLLFWFLFPVPILWPPDAKSPFNGKDSEAGKNWRQKGKGVAENEMVS